MCGLNVRAHCSLVGMLDFPLRVYVSVHIIILDKLLACMCCVTSTLVLAVGCRCYIAENVTLKVLAAYHWVHD